MKYYVENITVLLLAALIAITAIDPRPLIVALQGLGVVR